ncbi:twin-arginine translocase TatA/TatE family subunit [Ornithinicoccus hortensis]|uniref:Sec-independent protein translocase protein TatB n=1 Tax=Ornithinicoccus hortensis TaxID=82346 RepID=A0A542YQ18_9MICO|nr:twin-arginine translocase TatA/TatE family subunit [Ornithinicoccus hortensis]TQL50147.1 sec-independent protein translocase protein TatB [Ornithinicoccus hortensis]
MWNLNGTELLILIVLALVILGPDRLPEYASRLAKGVRQLRDLAEGAKVQLREEMGPGFDDVDWKQLDPRQYDPRRIVREALQDEPPAAASADAGQAQPPQREVDHASGGGPTVRLMDPSLPTPFDPEAT